MRILIAEDDEALAKFVRQGLESECYTVDVLSDGEQARIAATESDYDLVILDLNLPKLDGVNVLRHLRSKKPSLPVLILTQRTKVEDRVQCLDTGADDYLAKPFSFSELSARIRALVRRSHLPSESVLNFGDLKLDRVQRVVERAGRRIDLTAKEFLLLEYLMRNAGRSVTRSMIIEHVWNLTFDTTTNVVDVYINYASAHVDHRKAGKLAQSIQMAFEDIGAFDDSTDDSVNPDERMPFRTVQTIENGRRPSTPNDSVAVAAEEANVEMLQSELRRTLQHEIASHIVSVNRRNEDLVISLHESGFFSSGSATLQSSAQTALDRIAAILANRTCSIRIEGHTDNVPIHTAHMASNWELSTARSTELIRLLITRYHVSPVRLSAAGYAQYHPIATNATAQGRAQNRRVDLVILPEHVTPAEPLASAARQEPSPVLR